MIVLKNYILLLLFFAATGLQAQLYRGKVVSYNTLLPSSLVIKLDSSLVWVQSHPTNSLYLVYEGAIHHFHSDIYAIRFRTQLCNVGWGLLDETTGKQYPYAQVLVDTSHRKNISPVFIKYEDGSCSEYPFKGQMKLDTLKLNALHPTYTVITNYRDPITKDPLVITASYTNNTVIGRDTTAITLLVRFKKDSLLTVPTSRYKTYNTWVYMRDNNWVPKKNKSIPKQKAVLTFPDMSGWRLPGDSLIYRDIEEVKYGNDTLHKKKVTQYWKGQYMGEYSVTKENGTTDSSLYKNMFDAKGNLIGIITRWHQALTCDSALGRDERSPYWGYDGGTVEVERVQYPCPRYTYSIIRYSKKDTIAVKCIEDYNHEYKIHTLSCDTTWYFANGLKHLEKHYVDTTLGHTWRYAYVYDTNHKLQRYSVRVSHTNGYEVSMLYTVNGKDTAIVKSTTRYQRDSTQGQYIVYYSNPTTKMGWFKTYMNNKVSSYSVLQPMDSLCENAYLHKSFDQDSLPLNISDENTCSRIKKSKGRMEQWTYDRFAQYRRFDTLKTKSGFVVKGYIGPVGNFKQQTSPPLRNCYLVSIELQDRFRRPVLLTEYSDQTITRKIKYRYTK